MPHLRTSQQQITPGVAVGECDLGRGVFALRRFERFERIVTFDGPLIDSRFARAKGTHEGDVLQIGPDRYIDLEPPGCFINHSCEPNGGVVDDIQLVALRPITADEEIRIDYSTTMLERSWRMMCRCGSSRCRGVIGDFDELPPEVQLKYLTMEVVQSFIRGYLRQSAPAALRRARHL